MQQTQQTPGYPVPFFGASPGTGSTFLMLGIAALVVFVVVKQR
jgi:hypothetical protein